MSEPERYTLVLRALPHWNHVPGIQRMRAALKCLLRSFGLRCESITETPPKEPTNETL